MHAAQRFVRIGERRRRLALILRLYSDQSADEIQVTSPEFIAVIGLQSTACVALCMRRIVAPVLKAERD